MRFAFVVGKKLVFAAENDPNIHGQGGRGEAGRMCTI